MTDELSSPTLEELQTLFPYNPEEEVVNSQTSSSPINFNSVTVLELFDWNAFILKLPNMSFNTLHLIGKFIFENKTTVHYTSPLHPYDKENNWYMPIAMSEDTKPFRLIGNRNINEQFPENILSYFQPTEITLIDSPESYRYPNFNPGEQTA